MGHILATAKDQLYDCVSIARKLRVMLQSSETNVNLLKKKSSFLIQLAAKTVPRPLHCIPLVLTTDYHLHNYEEKDFPNKEKLEDPSFYHYAIFSDNVLATSVVVNSTVLHAKEPERHVFHIVTDKLNFAAMKMWFLVNAPTGAAIQVQNVDDFTWLNSSYCPVLRQLESARMIEYYFKAHQSSSLTAGSDNLKYRNPKYLSMLNHLRFYLPEVYPKLDKILFLDDDIVVQKDLTPLWSVNLQGMVNGAVETCKESFHRFDKYLNFSNPKISENFDPNACGWAFGMNIFDLREWRKRDITGIYHHWQDMVWNRLTLTFLLLFGAFRKNRLARISKEAAFNLSRCIDCFSETIFMNCCLCYTVLLENELDVHGIACKSSSLLSTSINTCLVLVYTGVNNHSDFCKRKF